MKEIKFDITEEEYVVLDALRREECFDYLTNDEYAKKVLVDVLIDVVYN